MGIESMIFSQESSQRQNEFSTSILTGVVKNNWDKEYPGQVQVELLMGEKGKTTLQWVRVMQPYCGNGYGEFFLPEIDTEVVIGFVGGDISMPVVLGCLWNKNDKIPEGKANDKNSVKSIRTKGGHEILFDETKDKEKIEIKTKGALDICMLDKEKQIVIADSNKKNMITMDADKGIITIQAEKKIVLKAGNEDMLVLDGSGKKVQMNANTVQIEGKQTLKLKGQTSNLEGSMISVKAQSTLKAESSAALQLKGAICKIN